MPDWDSLSNRLETDIDGQFSEPVELRPYKKSAYMGDTQPDNSRQVRNTIGYRISKYTTVRAGGTGSFITKRTEADILMEIREENCPDVVINDRAYLSKRNQWYDVSFVEYWGNGRNVLHLLKRHS